MKERKPKNIFVQGPIAASFIADSIQKHSSKTDIGGHSIFLGQVRADKIDGKEVASIEYTAYEDMAMEKMLLIREDIFAKYDLTCMHVYQSLGKVAAGEISLFVFTSSVHRKAAIDACEETVERLKANSLRKAIATAIVSVSQQETIDVIKNKRVPKGDVFEFSRAAGLLGIKKTSDVIPDCHPLPVEYASITHEIDGLNIIIRVEVHTIYKTGVEVEAMHGAAVTALTIYDMLKPIDKGVEISTIKLEAKKGGKTDFKDHQSNDLRCAVIVCSDGVAARVREDKSGKTIIEKFEKLNLKVAHES